MTYGYSAPAVTGSLGLLQELHERLSGTNGVPLLASTYKGLVIHTADEAGDAPGPDYSFGWGVINTHSAATLMAENAQWNSRPFIKEILLPDGEEIAFTVEADTNQPLRITICWSDPPYIQSSGVTLINDLDLRVIDPSGQVTNCPWVLNPSDEPIDHRGDAADTGDNTLDNVEQVVITNSIEGAYSIVINHKGNLVNNTGAIDGQEVSVILSGIMPENIDRGAGFFITTNGLPRISITNWIGSIYEISRREDLVHDPVWVEVDESPLNIIHSTAEWIDYGGSTNDIQFYSIEQVR